MARPTTTSERIAALDVIRGVAVLGILLVNVQLIRGATFTDVLTASESAQRTGVDRWVEIATGTVATGTSLGAFALLFGLGLALQLGRGRHDGLGSMRLVVMRRLIWLIPIALAHRLITDIDILLPYAACGLALVVLAGPSLPPARWWSRVLGGVGLTIVLAGPLLMSLLGSGTAESLLGERPEHAQALLAGGSWHDRLEVRALEWMWFQGASGFSVLILGWVLLGFALGNTTLVMQLGNRRRQLTALGVAFIGAGLMLRLGWIAPNQVVGHVRAPDDLGSAVALLGGALLALGLVSLIAGASETRAAERFPWQRLAAVGRMALSAYILQNAIVESVFAVPGASTLISPTGALALTATVWVGLLALCPWWMNRFVHGPVEWAWRSLTYWRVETLRRDTSAA